MKLLVTGLGGLIGSRIFELLSSKYEFEDLSRSSGVDIIDKRAVEKKVSSSSASAIIHLVAKADVDGCEKDKEQAERGEAWRVNVEGTRNIVNICEKTGKKIIYISTDFVFDGKKTRGDSYTEEDTPSPINWYATTKYEGEKIVQASRSAWSIVRLSYPYRSVYFKKDFVRAIAEKLKEGKVVKAVSDHIFTPTLIDDIAFAFDTLLSADARGIFHVVGSTFLTPYEVAVQIQAEFGLGGVVEKTTRDVFFKDRASRPFNLALSNGKITELGCAMKSFEEGLREMKRQTRNVLG